MAMKENTKTVITYLQGLDADVNVTAADVAAGSRRDAGAGNGGGHQPPVENIRAPVRDGRAAGRGVQLRAVRRGGCDRHGDCGAGAVAAADVRAHLPESPHADAGGVRLPAGAGVYVCA